MNDHAKTKAELVKELASLRRQLRSLEGSRSATGRVQNRRSGKRSLRKQEELLNQVTDHIHDIVVLADGQMVLQYITPSVRSILGYAPARITGTSALGLIHEEDVEGVSSVLTDSLREKKPGKAEFRYRHADGHYVWLETLGNLILNKKGGVDGVVLVCRDVTERRQAEDQLRQSEEQFRGLLESVSLIAVMLDLKGMVTFCNDHFLSIVQADRSEVVGKDWFTRFVPENQREQLRSMFVAGIQRGDFPPRYENEIVTTRGERRVIRWSNALLRGPRGQILGTASLGEDITERKRAEETLRQSEERHRLVLEHIDEIVYKLKLEGPSWQRSSVELVSPRVERILGFKPQAFLDNPNLWFTLVHPDDTASLAARSESIYRSGRPGSREYRMKSRSTDDYRWIEDRVVPQLDESGRLIGVFGVARDITERRRAEQEVVESEEKFRSLAEQSPNMIFINKRGRIVYANRQCEEIMGYSRSEFYSSTFDFLKLIAPESLDLIRQNFAVHLQGKNVPPYEYTLVTKEGKKIVGIHTTKLIEYAGERAILGIVTDITARRQAEVALRETNETLQALIQSSPLAITALDLTGNVELWNPAAERIFGWKAEEVVGRKNPIVPAEKDEEYRELRERVLQGESLAGVEVRRQRKDGTPIDVSLSTSLLRDAKGNARGIMALLADITERKMMERRLRLSDQVLQRVGSLVFVADSTGEIIYVSPSSETILGYEPQELLGNGWWTVSRKDPQAALEERDRVARICRKELPSSDSPYEAYIRHKRGETRCILWQDSAGLEGMLIGVGQDITELKRAEEALRQSEIRFKTLIEKSADVVAIMDADGILMYESPSVKSVLGYDPEELVGRSAFELLHAEDAPFVGGLFRQLLLVPGQSLSAQFRYRHKDGTWKWLEATGTNNLEDATVNGIVINYRDISHRKLAEQELVRLRKAVESSGEVVFMTDREGVFTFVNPAFTTVYGITAGEVVGKATPRILKSGLMTEDTYKLFWESILDKRIVQGEIINQTKDGRLLTIDSSVNPILDDHGAIIGFLAIQRDVTEQRQTEEKIREQAALLDVAQDAIIVRTLDDQIVFWNKGAERIYGWTSEEAIGKNALELLYRDLPPQLEELNRSLAERGEWAGELRQVRRDMSEVTVESRWTLVHDKNGVPLSKLSVNTDVTDKKRLEKQFLRAQRMESVGTLAGGIAHDLNNVLAPVLISLQILRGKLPNPQDRGLLDRLESTVQRGADLVKQVLTFSRGTEIDRSVLQIRHLIDDIRRFAKETFPASVEISTDVPKDLWTVSGDSTQIHQILLNLCVNARDAMPNGGKLNIEAQNLMVDESLARLDVEAKAGPYIVVTVSDTGVGIPLEIRDKIFEPFFTTKEVGRGTGLGLSTAYAIVKGHGGFIHVYSEVGEGTTFKVYLPAISSEETQAPAEAQLELVRGSGELVLLVDDETAICEITRMTLENNGYRVIVSHDGADALTQYFSNRASVELVITDISMPIMDGPALIRALRRLDPSLRIIATTGLGDRLKVAEIQKSNIEAFLSKPFTAEKLLMTVHEVLKNAR